MKKEIAELWVEDLRSGKHAQGAGRLCHSGPNGIPAFCCLGRLCELAIEHGGLELLKEAAQDPIDQSWTTFYNGQEGVLPPDVQDWAGMNSRFGIHPTDLSLVSLATLNDDGRTFLEIADYIEKHWKSL